jgi:asparagine synthase (glutamine-hydrolysing)
MCGIAGIVHSEPSHSVPVELIHDMCTAIRHRGPDDFGHYTQGCVSLGMRRLSIIDLHTGHQPMANEDGTVWIVFNGEIYNYRQLRQELMAKGHQFHTTTDTEVIVHLFEEFGENCVQRLRGMFAFAIWDTRQQLLLLARDRLGIKPLYYAERPEGLIFASELKALLRYPDLPREIDPPALAEYFTHLCVPGELSIFKAIRKLPAAHILTFHHGRVRLRRYWYVQPSADQERSEHEWTEQLRHRLAEVIRLHLVADVPVGAFLSGGLDSGAMVALMAQASAEPIRTFTVGFATDSGRFDERLPAKAIVNRYATQHQECLLTASVTDILPGIIQAFDEPFANSSAIPNWLVCQETARHVKVAMSGLGGDEVFGGYERYVGLQLGEWYQRLPWLLRRTISGLAQHLPHRHDTSYLADRVKRFIAAGEMSCADRYRSFITTFSDPADILHPDLYASLGMQEFYYDRTIRTLQVQQAVDLGLFTDLYLYLPDDLLTLTDRISMAHSLEVRVPFLDHELVEFLAQMPARLKVKRLQKKILFRQAVSPWLPAEHLRRPKQGFSVPLSSWLKGPLRTMLADLVSSHSWQQSAWIRPKVVQRLVEEHCAGKANHESRLWAILCFHEWERQYNASPSPVLTA